MPALLDAGRVEAYLTRLGSPEVRHDAGGLATLQSAHLRAVPFHNLGLLANDGRPYTLQALEVVVDEAIAGVGGNCDRTTPPFATLLQSVGFDAHLVAATVRAPGDHFVCVVHIDGRRYLCDVGNGHPYLRPWELDGPRQTQSFNGWHFEFDPRAVGGPTLSRRLDDGAVRTVYVVDPAPRAYGDFAPMVNAHYSQAGFGPFLDGLRAVSIGADAVLTLRDAEYARHTRFGRFVRRVHGRDAVAGLLVRRFGLRPDLVHAALDVVARRRPDLLGDEPRWMTLGRGGIAPSASLSAPLDAPRREAVPDVLVSLATVGRTEAVERLLASLAVEVEKSGYPGRVGVLVVENHDHAARSPRIPPGLPVHRVPLRALADELERSAQTGLVPRVDELPAPIGVAREAQLHALRRHLDQPVAGLPHPTDHPTVVWMVDDDVAFEQLGLEGESRRRTHLLYRVARYWSTLPVHSVVLGTYTGDPPVPGLDCLAGQLHDLDANARRMLAQGPTASWRPPAAPRDVFDAYYDLTESAPPPDDAVWPYAPDRRDETVRHVALGLLRDLPRLLDGQQLTRPLMWDGEEKAPRASLRRGGNALFLDFDALFRWPTPVFLSADGVATRRADTLWAALARVDAPDAVVEATLPLLHGREGQSMVAERVAASTCASKSAAQVRGVVLARAVAAGRDVAEELPAREARVGRHRQRLLEGLSRLTDTLGRLSEWNDRAIEDALAGARAALAALTAVVEASDPTPGDAAELERFLARLPDAVAAWRGLW